jgi:hypothetical protein
VVSEPLQLARGSRIKVALKQTQSIDSKPVPMGFFGTRSLGRLLGFLHYALRQRLCGFLVHWIVQRY